MSGKILILLTCLLTSLAACTDPQPVSPATAQALVAAAWQANQHEVWEINWPAAPVGGPLIIAAWRAGDRNRFEILEAPAPALMGEVLVLNGPVAWSYNRFAPAPPVRLADPALSPAGAAFAIVDRLVTMPVETASRQAMQLDSGPAELFTLTLADGNSLALWRDLETALPVRLAFSLNGRPATWHARSFEPLPDPADGLFRPDRP